MSVCSEGLDSVCAVIVCNLCKQKFEESVHAVNGYTQCVWLMGAVSACSEGVYSVRAVNGCSEWVIE